MKDNLYLNGDLKKRQHEIIPKGKRRYWVQELRLWLLIDKKLTEEQANKKVQNFVRNYQQSLLSTTFKF